MSTVLFPSHRARSHPTPRLLTEQGALQSRIVLDFDPTRDGFAFPNAFAWTPGDVQHLTRALRPVLTAVTVSGGAGIGQVLGGLRGRWAGGALGLAFGVSGMLDRTVEHVARLWPSFGLCGGMALAATERWRPSGYRHSHTVPTCKLRASPMRGLLRHRQERTLRASGVRFLTTWLRVQALGASIWPHPPFADTVRREVGRIRNRIADGRPVVVGVVGDAPDPFAMHQVVAYGIEVGAHPLDAALIVYDPNAPGQVHRIETGPVPGAPNRVDLVTSIPTGPRAAGYHISTRAGRLAALFAVDV